MTTNRYIGQPNIKLKFLKLKFYQIITQVVDVEHDKYHGGLGVISNSIIAKFGSQTKPWNPNPNMKRMNWSSQDLIGEMN